MSMGITPRQRELLAYLSERDLCPSYEEMLAALDLKGKNAVARLLGRLEERGYIRRLPNRARAIEVLRYPQQNVVIRGERFRFIPRSRTVLPFGAEPAGELASKPAGRLQGASASPNGSRERSRQEASPPSGLRSSRGGL
jgi:repressor LexA